MGISGASLNMGLKKLIALPVLLCVLTACSSAKLKNDNSKTSDDYRDLATIQEENEMKEFVKSDTYQAFKKEFPKIWSEGLGGDNSSYIGPLPLRPTGSKCMDGNLVLLDYSKLKVTYDGKNYEEGPGMSGSAGNIIGIYSVKSDSENDRLEVSELFSNNLYDVSKILDEGSCPDIEVELNGVYFNRVGSESGLAKLKFNEETKTYEIDIN
jgi:hypothetical protein